jgi:Arc/MetJ-type ribon-helix-helix transcriptional regulator
MEDTGMLKLEIMDSEKITINLGAVDLGKVDLLVEEGFYGNRTDFIRTAIRNQLDRHEAQTSQSATRRAASFGALALTRKDLEAVRAKGQKLRLSVIGVLSLGREITPELAAASIESVYVRGVFRASDEVKAALADRTS